MCIRFIVNKLLKFTVNDFVNFHVLQEFFESLLHFPVVFVWCPCPVSNSSNINPFQILSTTFTVVYTINRLLRQISQIFSNTRPGHLDGEKKRETKRKTKRKAFTFNRRGLFYLHCEFSQEKVTSIVGIGKSLGGGHSNTSVVLVWPEVFKTYPNRDFLALGKTTPKREFRVILPPTLPLTSFFWGYIWWNFKKITP